MGYLCEKDKQKILQYVEDIYDEMFNAIRFYTLINAKIKDFKNIKENEIVEAKTHLENTVNILARLITKLEPDSVIPVTKEEVIEMLNQASEEAKKGFSVIYNKKTEDLQPIAFYGNIIYYLSVGSRLLRELNKLKEKVENEV